MITLLPGSTSLKINMFWKIIRNPPSFIPNYSNIYANSFYSITCFLSVILDVFGYPCIQFIEYFPIVCMHNSVGNPLDFQVSHKWMLKMRVYPPGSL